jgi:hypothetical protein
MKLKKLVSIALALLLTVFFTGTCFAGTLNEIVKRG